MRSSRWRSRIKAARLYYIPKKYAAYRYALELFHYFGSIKPSRSINIYVKKGGIFLLSFYYRIFSIYPYIFYI
nr:MAG TPA: hypothetical protein [Caudoviricetes sp.]